jgi:hypothetical protein
MSVFKDHKVSVNQLLGVIPEALLSKLSLTTKVDYYTKVLHGKKMFYLLLYGIFGVIMVRKRAIVENIIGQLKNIFSNRVF